MAKQIDPSTLVKASTYAKSIDKSVTWVKKLAKEGKLSYIIIDGVWFIIKDQ